MRVEVSATPSTETVAAAVAILHDAFAPEEGSGVTAEQFMAPRPGRQLITAERGDDVIGFARVDRYGNDHGLLAWLAVSADARSMGVGRRLIATSADRLAASGALSMFVECRVDDFYAPRRRFYERNSIESVSGGDYWLRFGEIDIQYDLLLRPLAGELTTDQIEVGARLIHSTGTGVRPARLDTALAWTLARRNTPTGPESRQN